MKDRLPYVNGVCLECDSSEGGHKEKTVQTTDGETLVFSIKRTHPTPVTKELRQYGQAIEVSAEDDPRSIIAQATSGVAKSMAGVIDACGVGPYANTLATFVVAPGGQGDPLAQSWSIAWKARFLVPVGTPDAPGRLA